MSGTNGGNVQTFLRTTFLSREVYKSNSTDLPFNAIQFVIKVVNDLPVRHNVLTRSKPQSLPENCLHLNPHSKPKPQHASIDNHRYSRSDRKASSLNQSMTCLVWEFVLKSVQNDQFGILNLASGWAGQIGHNQQTLRLSAVQASKPSGSLVS